ncbi:MAG: DUF2244 domain-containing protein [Gammaproteobacteria bacterium]
MIYETEAAEEGSRTFVVMPNRSMSWPALVTAYVAIVVVALSVAIYFYTKGLTLILPFSGLELLFLGAVLYLTAWRSDWREVITVGEELISVQTGRHGPESHFEFQRQWVKLILAHAGGWYPGRLLLRSHGHQIEIGRFLNEQERQGLAEMLAAAMGQRLEQYNSIR